MGFVPGAPGWIPLLPVAPARESAQLETAQTLPGMSLEPGLENEHNCKPNQKYTAFSHTSSKIWVILYQECQSCH